MGPIVHVVETSNAWCPLKYHAYLIKPDGTGLFRCAWLFDGQCIMVSGMVYIFKEVCGLR